MQKNHKQMKTGKYEHMKNNIMNVLICGLSIRWASSMQNIFIIEKDVEKS